MVAYMIPNFCNTTENGLGRQYKRRASFLRETQFFLELMPEVSITWWLSELGDHGIPEFEM